MLFEILTRWVGANEQLKERKYVILRYNKFSTHEEMYLLTFLMPQTNGNKSLLLRRRMDVSTNTSQFVIKPTVKLTSSIPLSTVQFVMKCEDKAAKKEASRD